MGKKFMGLNGTDHFWDRAKAWILEQITSTGIDKQSVIDTVYPVGSLYWSSKDTDPSTLFGGTWVQIKDRFVLACGDTYKTVDETGGASSVTLSVSNMPSHSHSFTPSGEVSSHSHGLNGHTHSFSVSGTTGGMSANATGDIEFVNRNVSMILSGGSNHFTYRSGNLSFGNSHLSPSENWAVQHADNSGGVRKSIHIDVSHTHSFSYSGTTEPASGNTESATPTFTGNAGTTSPEGSGTSFSILPPYVVKYCWERTA